MGFIDVSAANGIQESGGRQTHSRGRKPPVWGKENWSPEGRSERDGNEGRQKAWLLTCHVHTYGAAAHGFGLTPSPLSVGLPRLRLRLRRYRAPYHFHALPGVLIFGYASMNHPRLFVCRPPDSQIRLAALAGCGSMPASRRRAEL